MLRAPVGMFGSGRSLEPPTAADVADRSASGALRPPGVNGYVVDLESIHHDVEDDAKEDRRWFVAAAARAA